MSLTLTVILLAGATMVGLAVVMSYILGWANQAFARSSWPGSRGRKRQSAPGVETALLRRNAAPKRILIWK
jgi:hypothetical protein